MKVIQLIMKSEKTKKEVETAISKLGTMTSYAEEELITFTDDNGEKYEVVKRQPRILQR